MASGMPQETPRQEDQDEILLSWRYEDMPVGPAPATDFRPEKRKSFSDLLCQVESSVPNPIPALPMRSAERNCVAGPSQESVSQDDSGAQATAASPLKLQEGTLAWSQKKKRSVPLISSENGVQVGAYRSMDSGCEGENSRFVQHQEPPERRKQSRVRIETSENGPPALNVMKVKYSMVTDVLAVSGATVEDLKQFINPQEIGRGELKKLRTRYPVITQPESRLSLDDSETVRRRKGRATIVESSGPLENDNVAVRSNGGPTSRDEALARIVQIDNEKLELLQKIEMMDGTKGKKRTDNAVEAEEEEERAHANGI